ncbi:MULTISPECIES: hypothetical protein [unclassified Coleofasciculus]|uniref:hypothetical protein n=1 Tax=unclassified Coleofasciculus TaxID=2692782 RepID=UPI0018829F5A|nr:MULTISPECIES: hypothetical protein [unclassified Coleofasciculus]MBE9129159.1 hypothetical protein [Coleofasciculus sp. LEGE 07081]
MLAKRPNSYEDNLAIPPNQQNTAVTDAMAELKSEKATVTEPVAKVRDNVITVDFGSPDSVSLQIPWSDYEELFPTVEVEATEPFAILTQALVNRRCYWLNYWPPTQVFRIKEIDLDNNTVYLNFVYRWVNATQIKLLKALKPSRVPKDIELAHLARTLAEQEKDSTNSQ